MRKSRKYLIGLAGLVVSLGLVPSAFADGASENTSAVYGGFAPNGQSATNFGAGTLFTQVTTVDTDGVANASPVAVGAGPSAIVNKAAERVYIDFDNDFKFDTSHVPKCSANLSTSTTAQAIALCKSSIVGSGQALAYVPFEASPGNFISLPLELTVTAFNGPTSTTGGACLPPADNVGGPEGCEFVGGQPTIRLHAYNATVPYISVVLGEIQNSPSLLDDDGGATFGKRLAVTDAPDAGLDAGALALFNSTIGKKTDVKTTKKVKCKSGPNKGKKKCKKTTTKTYNYVTAKCADDGAAKGGLEWDFRADWVYDDGTTDTDSFGQKCGN